MLVGLVVYFFFFSPLSFIGIDNKSFKVAPWGCDCGDSPVCAGSCLCASGEDGSCLENSLVCPDETDPRVGKLRQPGASERRRSWERGPEPGRGVVVKPRLGRRLPAPRNTFRRGSEPRRAPVGFWRVPPPGNLKNKHKTPKKNPKPQAAFWPGSKEKLADEPGAPKPKSEEETP